MRKEQYKNWLDENTNLSEGTKSNYTSAISQISTWAGAEQGISMNLYELTDVSELDKSIRELENKPEFDSKNALTHNKWSASLNFFKQFIHNEKRDKFEDLYSRIKDTTLKLLAEKKLLNKEDLNDGYKLFSQKFGPNVLKNLDGESLLEMFFIGNKEGLNYWLEFKNDDEFQTQYYGSISGGSSYKFIMFKRNLDDQWVTGPPGNPKVLPVNEAISFAKKIRDSLMTGAEIIEQILIGSESLDDYETLQEKLDQNLDFNMSNLGWVHKYFHMIYPNVIDDYHSTRWQKHALVFCGIAPIKKDNLYEMAGQIIKIADKCDLPVNYVTGAINEIAGAPINYYRIEIDNTSKDYWSDMKTNSYVAIGWSELGNLNLYNESENKKDIISNQLKKLYNFDSRIANKKAGEIAKFFNNMRKDDVVVAVLDEEVHGIGRISGEYEFISDKVYSHCIGVEWLKIFEESILLPKPSEGKLTTFSQYKTIENIMEIKKLINEPTIEDKISVPSQPVVPLSNLPSPIADIESVLKRKKQLILYGAPGTGKTYYAEKACNELASRNLFKKSFNTLSQEEKDKIVGTGRTNGVVRMCCFHPSYGYEDFIEGIKPKVVEKQTVFEHKNGIFKQICLDADENKDKNFYLIIDEINRGDISRIFGELIMLIENGKRGKQIILPLSNELFSVPENVYIVGTMNTADRSIALLDVALRRRFGFIELMTDYSLFKGVEFDGLPLDGWLIELNSRIREHIGKEGRNLQIGHSYFLEKEKAITDQIKFKRVIKEDIVPLIEEYCYGDYSLMSNILGDGIIDIKNQAIKTDLFTVQDSSDLISALLSPCPTLRIGSERINNEEDEEDEVEDEGEDKNGKIEIS